MFCEKNVIVKKCRGKSKGLERLDNMETKKTGVFFVEILENHIFAKMLHEIFL